MKITIEYNKTVGEKKTKCLTFVKANPMASGRLVYGDVKGIAILLDKPVAELKVGDTAVWDTEVYGELLIGEIVDSETGEVRTTKPTDGTEPVALQEFKN